MMEISDTEFLLARQYNRNVNQVRDHAQALVDYKNAELVKAGRIIADLRAQLAAERTKNADLVRQIRASLQ